MQQFLKREFRLVPDVGSVIDLQTERFTQLSAGALDFLSNMEMTPLRLFVSGAAGCGKTLLAVHYHEEALKNGQKPLLVCFNASLAERFRDQVSDGGRVETFHALFKSIAERPGSGIDFDVTTPGGPDWQNLFEQVTAVPLPGRRCVRSPDRG